MRIENISVYTDTSDAGYGVILNNANVTYTDVYIRNNIIQGFDIYPIEIDGNLFTNLYIQNNNFYGNGTNSANVTGTPTNYINNGNITTDPEFFDPPDSLSLQSTSGAIDEGLDLGYSSDYLGTSIPQGSEADIGAFEFIVIDSTATEILTFTIPNQISSVVNSVDSSVVISMPYGTNVTNLTPIITLSPLATVSPLSGVSQNFTNEVAYTVTANKSNTQEWGCSVIVQSSSINTTYLKKNGQQKNL
jgi:hypothetical protein